MTTGIRVLAIVATVLVPGAAFADVKPACQQAVARSGARFARAALKIGQVCAMRAGAAGAAGCEPHAGGTTGNATVDRAIARAASQLATQVSDACARSDLSSFARGCPDPTGPPLSLSELVTCLRDTHLDRVGALLAVEFPGAALRTEQQSGCSGSQSCQCRCSPSGAFLEPTTDDVR